MRPLITIFISLFLIIALSGCFSVEKYNNFIKEKTGIIKAQSAPDSNDYLTVKSDAMMDADSSLHSKKVKNSFIPAILYWQWNYSIESNLGHNVPVNVIRPAIFNYAESISLKDKLNGKHLEISIKKVPSSFTYTQKGMALIFIIGYSVQGQEVIYPSNDELVVSYRILNNGSETKRGTITVRETGQPVSNRKLKSAKKFTWAYIDDYYGDIQGMSKSVLNQIVAEI